MRFIDLHPFERAKVIFNLIFKDLVLHGLLLLATAFIAIATLFYHHIEGWKWLDALYFSIVTLSTVGYGDVTPHTELGKIFTIFYILCGVGLFATVLTNIGIRVLSYTQHKNQS